MGLFDCTRLDREVILLPERLDLDGEALACCAVMRQQVDSLGISESDRGLNSTLEQFRSDEELAGKSRYLAVCSWFLMHFIHLLPPTLKLCGANEAQRSMRPNERLVMRYYA